MATDWKSEHILHLFMAESRKVEENARKPTLNLSQKAEKGDPKNPPTHRGQKACGGYLAPPSPAGVSKHPLYYVLIKYEN